MMDGFMPEMQKHNLVNTCRRTRPDKAFGDTDFATRLYLSPEKTLCLVGLMQNYYAGWCSFTSLDDPINQQIFDVVASGEFQEFASLYTVFGQVKYEMIDTWYTCKIERTNDKGMWWKTPFGHYYGDHNKGDHGRFFAGDIQCFYDELIRLCTLRICDGQYVPLLKSYHEMLCSKTDCEHYYLMKPLISILEREAYLRLCPDVKIRELYLACIAQCGRLYSAYMTEAR